MGVLDLFKLDGKVALVTGAGQGMGRMFALALAEAGAAVVVADINEQTAQSVTAEVAALGRRALCVKTDVLDGRQIEAMVAAALDAYGRLDIAVNCAAAVVARAPAARTTSSSAVAATSLRSGPAAEKITVEDWDQTLNIFLRAVFFCCQAEAQPMIRQQRGKIINFSSIYGTLAPGGVTYPTAKAGVVMLTKTLATEWAKYNINVNCISPSFTLTPGVHRRTSKARRDLIRSLHPMGWFERPEDLVGTVIYLASDASNYVTGRDHVVDGGLTLNVWFDPPQRVAPPLVSREEEVHALKHDLDVQGIRYDEEVVTGE